MAKKSQINRDNRRMRMIAQYADRRADLRGLRDDLPWLTTGKDAVKIPERWLKGRTLLVLEEEVKPREAGRMADWLLAQLEA